MGGALRLAWSRSRTRVSFTASCRASRSSSASVDPGQRFDPLEALAQGVDVDPELAGGGGDAAALVEVGLEGGKELGAALAVVGGEASRPARAGGPRGRRSQGRRSGSGRRRCRGRAGRRLPRAGVVAMREASLASRRLRRTPASPARASPRPSARPRPALASVSAAAERRTGSTPRAAAGRSARSCSGPMSHAGRGCRRRIASSIAAPRCCQGASWSARGRATTTRWGLSRSMPAKAARPAAVSRSSAASASKRSRATFSSVSRSISRIFSSARLTWWAAARSSSAEALGQAPEAATTIAPIRSLPEVSGSASASVIGPACSSAAAAPGGSAPLGEQGRDDVGLVAVERALRRRAGSDPAQARRPARFRRSGRGRRRSAPASRPPQPRTAPRGRRRAAISRPKRREPGQLLDPSRASS